MTILGGGEICGLMGLVSSATTLYPEEVILDHDAYMHIYEIIKKNSLEDLDHDLDIIKAVGQRGHFLAQKHTRKHIRDFRLSPLQRKKDQQGEHRDPRELAIEMFKDIESSHHPEPLPEKKLNELDRIIQSAENEAKQIFGP
jgi:trimethylamine--corrinoid protein Co-methyltransferase